MPQMSKHKDPLSGGGRPIDVAQCCHSIVCNLYPHYDEVLLRLIAAYPDSQLPLLLGKVPEWISELVYRKLRGESILGKPASKSQTRTKATV